MGKTMLIELSSKELEDTFGGSEATYQAGYRSGKTLRKALDNALLVVGLLLFLGVGGE